MKEKIKKLKEKLPNMTDKKNLAIAGLAAGFIAAVVKVVRSK